MYSSEFERIGKRLFAEHLVGGNFGNISRREGEGFYIKRTGTYLDAATEPVFVPLSGEPPKDASTEFRVHREVYKNSRHAAIVHAHPPHAVALSFLSDEIKPVDSEGELLCPVIPVVTGAPGSQEIADSVATALARSNLVIVRGHGTFAAGKDLDEAFVFTSLAEYSCRILSIKGGCTGR
ncbi:MAG TPA: aldolase [Methanoregula sp.]|nr:aldolase [Methanoregula sp.]